MGELLGRRMMVRLGRAGSVGREIQNLRMSADVKLTRTSTPSQSTVRIWNPRSGTEAEMQHPDAVVEVYAGYGSPILIARGNPIQDGVTLEKTGPTSVLSIEFADSVAAYTSATLNRTFGSGVTLRDIFAACAAELGLPLGAVTVDLSRKLPYGAAISGAVSDILDGMGSTVNAEWFTRDGVLHFVTAGGSTGEPAVLFSSELKNIIGTPRKKSGGKVEITALLSPGIRPGKSFRVEARDFTGDFIADDVSFIVDNWSGDFLVRINGHER